MTVKLIRNLLLLAVLHTGIAPAGELLDGPPRNPGPDGRYVFYLHGQIVQDQGPRPTHPQFGLYDYPLILETLAGHDLVVISERREPGTGREDYAKKVVRQVEELLENGVSPDRITVLGFSAGGMIVMHASSAMEGTDVGFVIMASCSDWVHDASGLRLNGRVLSVYEQTDFAGSCQALADRDPGPTQYKEVRINTGKRHGAFYVPDDAWVLPVVDWIKGTSETANE